VLSLHERGVHDPFHRLWEPEIVVSSYVGELKTNEMNGQGALTLLDGHRYVGEFKDGDRHGQGTMTLPDGTIQKGLWKDDVFVD
jgi:hypothetical protein